MTLKGKTERLSLKWEFSRTYKTFWPKPVVLLLPIIAIILVNFVFLEWIDFRYFIVIMIMERDTTKGLFRNHLLWHYCPYSFVVPFTTYPAANYIFKVDNKNTRTRCEIYLKLTLKTLEWYQWRLNMFHTLLVCFYC